MHQAQDYTLEHDEFFIQQFHLDKNKLFRNEYLTCLKLLKF